MPAPNFGSLKKPKVLVALLLTFASGLVDIVGFLGVYTLFTAHLTGTTVHLAETLVERHKHEAIAGAAVVGAFFLGSLFGRTLIEIGFRKGVESIASVALMIEAGLIAAVATLNFQHAISSAPIVPMYGQLSMLAAAMGLQTATLTRVGPLTVHTTFVTGMVNKLAQLTSHISFQTYDLACRDMGNEDKRRIRRTRQQEGNSAVFLFGIWATYLAGAAGGAAGYRAWGTLALFAAVGLLLLAVVIDQIEPMAIEEEQEQSER